MPKITTLEMSPEGMPPDRAHAAPKGCKAVKNGNGGRGGDLEFEAKLWQAANLLRGNLDSADYKHVVLGLIFLK